MNTLVKRTFTIDDIKKEVELCLEKVKRIGLIRNEDRTIQNYEFAFNNRSKKTFGTCRTITVNAKYRITLNLLYTQYGEIEKVKQTIMHEVLHSLPGGHGHKGKWAYYANAVNSKYPEYHITRTTCSDNYFKALQELTIPNYIVSCPQCNTEWQFTRETYVIKGLKHHGKHHEVNCPICKKTLTGWKLKIKGKEVL